MISAADLEFRGYLRAPIDAKVTALGLWTKSTDVFGRRELLPELIAGEIFPGEAATELVAQHIEALASSGFLTIYRAEGTAWIQLARPLKADTRGAADECPPPPVQGLPRTSTAMGGAGERAGARERARERMRAEHGERTSEWGVWEQEQERRPAPPRRPMLLDAPPIGCPDHPRGKFADCGPCGTARKRHDHWVAEQRYEEQLTDYEERVAEHEQQQASEVIDDDEPF